MVPVDRELEPPSLVPVVDDEERLPAMIAVAAHVHVRGKGAKTLPVEVDGVPLPPPGPLARRDGESEGAILRAIGFSVLRGMNDVELCPEEEGLALGPVLGGRPPEATVPIALTEEEHAVVEQVAAEGWKRRDRERSSELRRRTSGTTVPCAAAERPAHEECRRVEIDGVLDDGRAGQLVLQQAGDAQWIAEVAPAEHVDVLRVGAVLGAVASKPITQELKVRGFTRSARLEEGRVRRPWANVE